jgi:hypothetical protein
MEWGDDAGYEEAVDEKAQPFFPLASRERSGEGRFPRLISLT